MSIKTSLLGLRLLTLLFIVWITQSGNVQVLAQSSPETQNRSLPFNKAISGQLRGKGEKVTYIFDVPVDQDVVVEYRANKLVFHSSCLLTGETQSDDTQCQHESGSGGDRPSYNFILISTLGQKDQHATVTLTRILDGASTYQITAYLATPQTVKMDQSINFNSLESQPFQVYTLDADNILPFTVEIEDAVEDDNFLWTAYLPFGYRNFPVFNKEGTLPDYIDGASSANGARGIAELRLYYLGGRTFRVLVKSTRSYALYAANAALPMLDENENTDVTVSYRQPIRVMQLRTRPGEQTQVNFNVTAGTGAIGFVYEVSDPVYKSRDFGFESPTEASFPLSGSIQRTTIKSLYVMVQIPYKFTRDEVKVKVNWQHVN